MKTDNERTSANREARIDKMINARLKRMMRDAERFNQMIKDDMHCDIIQFPNAGDKR